MHNVTWLHSNLIFVQANSTDKNYPWQKKKRRNNQKMVRWNFRHMPIWFFRPNFDRQHGNQPERFIFSKQLYLRCSLYLKNGLQGGEKNWAILSRSHCRFWQLRRSWGTPGSLPITENRWFLPFLHFLSSFYTLRVHFSNYHRRKHCTHAHQLSHLIEQ